MKLIWTYNYNANMVGAKQWHLDILTNFYKASIISAKKLGYETIIYTNTSHSHIFEPYVDEVICVDDYEQSPLFDSFKIKVLEERSDDFYLIDGDVILNSKLPELDVDVTFDAYESKFWKPTYGDPLKELRSIGVNDVIPLFYIEKAEKMFNCGILRITNKELKKAYVCHWKRFNQFVKDNKYRLFLDHTTVGAQYILTILSKEMGVKWEPLSEFLGNQNQYYRHYAGRIKYKIKAPSLEIKTLI
jgi:hypothetical protein